METRNTRAYTILMEKSEGRSLESPTNKLKDIIKINIQ
jgi:hypothetical protein